MRFRTTLLATLIGSALLVSPALAADDDGAPDPIVRAVGDVLHGPDAATRERARETLRRSPEAAVGVLLQTLEELSAARRPPVAFSTVEAVAPAPAPAEDAQVVRIYDVRDLMGRAGLAESLAERLRAAVAGDDSVTAQGDGIVIVRASPLRQQDVARLLQALRDDEAEIVTLETRVVQAALAAPLGRAAGTSRPGDVLDLDDPAAVVAGWLAAGDAEVVTSPLLSCFPGQRASVQAGKEVSFVADFDVEVAQSPTSPIVDPVIDTVFEGVDVALTPFVPQEGRVRLSVQVTTTEVVEMERFATSLGVFSEPVEVQIPSVFRTELDRSLDLPDGGVAVVRIGDDRDARRFLVIRVARERLADDD